MNFRLNVFALFILLTAVSGCVIVPREGVSSARILDSAETFGKAEEKIVTYDVTDITPSVIQHITNYHSTVFKRNFGSLTDPGSSVIGVGDELTITIFEASTEGLFSTTDNKSTVIKVVVQRDGKATIPYVGDITFAGKTLKTARANLLRALDSQAVEPDVLISLSGNESRVVTVTGEVKGSTLLPIGLSGSRLLEIIASAGGPTRSAHDTKVTIVRGTKRATTRLTNVIEHASENIFVKPKDQVVLEYDPSRFVVLGASGSKGRIEFNAPQVSLVEAIAMAGGKNSAVSDPKGVFIFRYENKETIKELLGEDRYNERFSLGHWSDHDLTHPMVYRLDMSKPGSYLVGQNFRIRSGDLLYMTTHPATEFTKFLNLLGLSLGSVAAVSAL